MSVLLAETERFRLQKLESTAWNRRVFINMVHLTMIGSFVAGSIYSFIRDSSSPENHGNNNDTSLGVGGKPPTPDPEIGPTQGQPRLPVATLRPPEPTKVAANKEITNFSIDPKNAPRSMEAQIHKAIPSADGITVSQDGKMVLFNYNENGLAILIDPKNDTVYGRGFVLVTCDAGGFIQKGSNTFECKASTQRVNNGIMTLDKGGLSVQLTVDSDGSILQVIVKNKEGTEICFPGLNLQKEMVKQVTDNANIDLTPIPKPTETPVVTENPLMLPDFRLPSKNLTDYFPKNNTGGGPSYDIIYFNGYVVGGGHEIKILGDANYDLNFILIKMVTSSGEEVVKVYGGEFTDRFGQSKKAIAFINNEHMGGIDSETDLLGVLGKRVQVDAIINVKSGACNNAPDKGLCDLTMNLAKFGVDGNKKFNKTNGSDNQLVLGYSFTTIR